MSYNQRPDGRAFPPGNYGGNNAGHAQGDRGYGGGGNGGYNDRGAGGYGDRGGNGGYGSGNGGYNDRGGNDGSGGSGGSGGYNDRGSGGYNGHGDRNHNGGYNGGGRGYNSGNEYARPRSGHSHSGGYGGSGNGGNGHNSHGGGGGNPQFNDRYGNYTNNTYAERDRERGGWARDSRDTLEPREPREPQRSPHRSPMPRDTSNYRDPRDLPHDPPREREPREGPRDYREAPRQPSREPSREPSRDYREPPREYRERERMPSMPVRDEAGPIRDLLHDGRDSRDGREGLAVLSSGARSPARSAARSPAGPPASQRSTSAFLEVLPETGPSSTIAATGSSDITRLGTVAATSTPPTSGPSGPSVPSGSSAPSAPTADRAASVMGTTGSEVVNVAEQLQALQLRSFFVRPGFGKDGRKIHVRSNYFAVRATGPRAKLIYHYDVDIVPFVKVSSKKQPRGLLRAVWEQFVVEPHAPDWAECFSISAFDGRRNVFCPIKYPIPDGETYTLQTALSPNREVHRPKNGETSSSSDDEYRRWRLTFKHVAVIDLENVMQFCRADKNTPRAEEAALTGVMCTNVLLRDFPSKNYAQVGATGNKFFTLDGARPIPQGGVVCRGFLQSFRYSNSGLPLINIDLAFSAFLSSGPALEVVARILGSGPGGMRGGPGGMRRGAPGAGPAPLDQLTDQQIAILKRKLRGARFTVTHRQSSRLHTVISVTLKSASDIVFEIEGPDGQPRRINIPDYYKEYYQAPVRNPRLPCIQYGKTAYVPLEFVNLADFNSLPPTNLTAEQTAEMIKIAAMKPLPRAEAVMNWRRELAYESQAKIAAWGLQVNQQMVEVSARVLPSPGIQYRHSQERVNNGSWRMRGQKFLRPVNRPLTNWAVISFDRFCDTADMQRWVTFLCQRLQGLGVDIANRHPPIVPPTDPRNPDGLMNALKQGARDAYMVSKETPQLLLVILPGRDAWLYEEIKQKSWTGLQVPVPTQCMQAAKIKTGRGIDAYTDNLAMKIAAKLGGISHGVPPQQLPGIVPGRTMILGADLGHPPFRPGQESRDPTVACSIATYNAECNAYSAQIRLQEGRSEVIVDMSDMVEQHLRVFARHNDDAYPERILIFRDGISEGQYAATVQYEHSAVVKACARIQPDYRPRILICVCAKRHNTRFFGNAADCDNRTGNLPAGLVVDSTVTHPYAFDFFLQAHAGLVGTARPTHYICLLDELALTPDELQKLVHGLCHSFARCTSSVSLVPVCYMADLVCQKARVIVQKGGNSMTPSETSGSRTVYRGGDNVSVAGTARGHIEDIYQIQKMMALNPELSRVGWWM